MTKDQKDIDDSNDQPDTIENALCAAVTVDGTRQKRYGFNSLLGVVFIISVDTGEVLDYEVKCKCCFVVNLVIIGTSLVSVI